MIGSVLDPAPDDFLIGGHDDIDPSPFPSLFPLFFPAWPTGVFFFFFFFGWFNARVTR